MEDKDCELSLNYPWPYLPSLSQFLKLCPLQSQKQHPLLSKKLCPLQQLFTPVTLAFVRVYDSF